MKKKLILATLICTLTMSSVALAAPADKYNGKCGDSLEYYYSEKTGVLTFSGEGTIYDYKTWEELPWSAYFDEVTRVKIKSDAEVPLWAISKKAANKHFAEIESKQEAVKTKPSKTKNKPKSSTTKEKVELGQVINEWN